jgi:hypothetical protein
MHPCARAHTWTDSVLTAGRVGAAAGCVFVLHSYLFVEDVAEAFDTVLHKVRC